jgi:5-methyltetrahydropteroyltriglutamate--homocysteine methyltransferase
MAINMAVNARVEHVGSLLRPPYLQQAREARAGGQLSTDEFKAAEDHAVREVIALQEEAGLPVVNDGELRRDSFQAELAAACDGFSGVGMDAWLWGDWHSGEAAVGDQSTARPEGLAVTGRLRKRRNLAAEEFTFVRAATSRQAKVTLPSPSLFANLWSPQLSAGAYPTLDAFLADVVDILREEVRELVRLGCGYIQLDAPHYPLLLDPVWREFYEQRGWPLQRWLSYGIELDNAVIEAGRPATFGFHLCRGNQLGRWLVAGGYEPIAGPIFGGVHADRLLLEYDDRSGWPARTRSWCSAWSPPRTPGSSPPKRSRPGSGGRPAWSGPTGSPSARSVDSPPPYREIRFPHQHNGLNWHGSSR